MVEPKTTVPGFLPELSPRVCCLLAEDHGLVHDIPLLSQLLSLGFPRIMVDLSGEHLRHVSGTTSWCSFFRRLGRVVPGVPLLMDPPERSGIVYTCAGGFIDLGHLRDFADLTRLYYYALVRRRRNGVVESAMFPLLQTHGGIRGDVRLVRDLPAAREDLDTLVSVARSIAYDVSVMYEIKTFGEERIGGRGSSFSPEDLVSNHLGTYVGGQALKRQIANSVELPTGEEDEAALATTFDVAVTIELADLLAKLKVVNTERTITAFNAIKGLWVKNEIWPVNFVDPDYLRRRNFHFRKVQPWLVRELDFCVDTDFPDDVDRELPEAAVTAYEATYHFESSLFETGPIDTFFSRDFEQYIDRVKTDARHRYGERFDQPDPP